MKTSAEIGELAAALAKAQGEFGAWQKDTSVEVKMKSGGKYSYQYATLAALLGAVRPALSANGLAIMQVPGRMDGGLVLTTTLAHSSGQWCETTIPIKVEGSDIKAVGSAITYMRRYVLQSLLGLAADDDDGGEASGHDHQRAPMRPRQQPRPPQDPPPQAHPALPAGLEMRGEKPWGEPQAFAAWLDANTAGTAAYVEWRKAAGKKPLDRDNGWNVGGSWAKLLGWSDATDGPEFRQWVESQHSAPVK